jgi:hypothetical protein
MVDKIFAYHPPLKYKGSLAAFAAHVPFPKEILARAVKSRLFIV